MTSAVAFSNFAGTATSDANNPMEETSNYEIPHRLTAKFSYQHDFWDDNTTRISVFATANQGRPYSFTFIDGGGYFDYGFTSFGDTIDDRHLLYIPTGADDPKVVFDPGFATTEFFAYLEENDLTQYAGGIAPRNSNHSDWWSKVDIRFEQEIPAFAEGHKMSAYFVIKNLGNLINDSWGVMNQASFPRMFGIVDMEIDTVNNQYVFNEFFERSQGRVTTPSTWEMRMGLKYSF